MQNFNTITQSVYSVNNQKNLEDHKEAYALTSDAWAGFKQWGEVGRKVSKGAKGCKIFMVCDKKITTIAFSLETNDIQWKNYTQKLANWHHIFGENKWENKIVKTYNINATPSYFILDATKKIIAKPYELSEVKAFIETL